MAFHIGGTVLMPGHFCAYFMVLCICVHRENIGAVERH